MQDWKKWSVCSVFWWLAAFAAGIGTFSSTYVSITVLAAILLGIAVFVFVGLALTRVFCQGSGAGITLGSVFAESPVYEKPVDRSDISAISRAAAQDAQGSDASVAQTPPPAEALGAGPAPAKPKTKKAAVEIPTEKKKAEKPAASQEKPEPEIAKSTDVEEAVSEKRPAALEGPRDGKADNLKEIKGIGPKLEKLCNSMGFYHFDQIASWTADEVAWVDANLEGFKGRVSRDKWIDQAKTLAAGGETEFSKRVEDGNVY